MVNWTQIIKDLRDSGVGPSKIAREVGCSQPTISAIADGRTKEVSHTIGAGILALHTLRCRKTAATTKP